MYGVLEGRPPQQENLDQIQIENTLSDEFVEKHSNWKPYTTEWITKNFGKHSIELDSRHNDIKVCLIDTKE